MLVKYEEKEVPIKGKGLVAAEDIAKGKQIWRYRECDHLIFKTKEEAMTAIKDHVPDMNKDKVREFISHIYTESHGKERILAYEIDDSHFFNHSKKHPNCGTPLTVEDGKKTFGIDISGDPQGTYAFRDIKKGEELLINYDYDKVFSFPDWLMEMRESYGLETSTKGWE